MTDNIRISDVVNDVLIIAHEENTIQLEAAFRYEGLTPHVIRRAYTSEELRYSQSIRVLLAHLEVWKLCLAKQSPVVVCEADFVPCRGFGNFRLPLPSSELNENKSIAWLYACGPTIYHLERRKELEYVRGHCAAPVALLLTANLSMKLFEFGLMEMRSSDPFSYSTWDTRISSYLKDNGVNSYIAVKNFGEHGVHPNVEHRMCGNLPAAHRADSLMSSLHYLPSYARGFWIRFFVIRVKAKLYGLMRFLSFRLIRLQTLWSKARWERLALIRFAGVRILSMH